MRRYTLYKVAAHRRAVPPSAGRGSGTIFALRSSKNKAEAAVCATKLHEGDETVTRFSKLSACSAIAAVGMGCSTLGLTNDKGFSVVDANGDGVITQQEAAQDAPLSDAFQKIDTNHDRVVSDSEYLAAHTAMVDVEFQRLDFDSNGVISERESKAARPSLRQVFAKVDSDNDGNVSDAEYQAASLNLLASTKFSTLDHDNDGVLDPTEVASNPALAADFTDFDINDDGMISRAEYERAQKR